MDKRPFGSRDWNHNGEYDFFDKVTDRYVYDKVSNYKPEPKPRKQYTYVENNDKPVSRGKSIFAWVIAILLNPVVLLGILGGILKFLGCR